MTTVDPREFRFAPRVPPLVVPRERLLTRLDEAARGPLAIVHSPGGGGKTALLTTWARTRDRPGFWATVDQSSGVRFAFWQHILGIGVATGLVPSDSALAELVMSSEMAANLQSVLLRGFLALDRPLVIVIDDYHLVSDPMVHDDLQAILTGGAPLHVILGSRTRTPLEDPVRTARLATEILTPGELLLTEEETAETVRAAGFDADCATALHTAFVGWPVATQAALIEFSSGRAGTLDEAIDRVRDEGIDRMFSRLDDSPHLLFLLRTSIASRFTREFALELGDEDADAHLVRAERDGFGTWHPRGARLEFAYQPLLREHLEQELLRRLPEEVAGLRTAYARDRDRNDDPLTAMRQHAANGAWAAVLSIVQRHYRDVLTLHLAEMRQLLEGAPAVELRRHPPLLVLLALTRNSQGDAGRETLLNLASLGIAYTRARLRIGDPVERIWLLFAMMGAQRIGGQYDQAVETAEAVLSAIRSLDDAQLERLDGLASRIRYTAAGALFFDGQLIRARELLDEVTPIAHADDDAWLLLQAESLRLLTLAADGDHTALDEPLQAGRARVRPHGWYGRYSAAGYHYAEAFLALETFDADGARTQLAALEQHEHTMDHWPIAARLRGLAALVDGQPFEGLRVLADDIAAHEDRPPISRWMQGLLTLTRADLLLADGEPHRARGALRASGRNAQTLALGSARTALALGRPDHAISLATPPAWSDGSDSRSRAEAFLVIGVAAYRVGRREEARIAIERAMTVLETHALRRPLMMAPRQEVAALLDLIGVDAAAELSGIPDVMPAVASWPGLTGGEMRIVTELEHSGGIESLAATLYVSPNTVKTHLRSIYRKLGVSSREEAIAVAHLRGLLGDLGEAP